MSIYKNSYKYYFHFIDECPPKNNIIFDLYNLQSNNDVSEKNISLVGSDIYGAYSIKKLNQKYNTPLYGYYPKWDLVNYIGIESIPISDKEFNKKNIKKYKSTCLFGRYDDVRVSFMYNLYKIGYYNNENIFNNFANLNKNITNTDAIEFTKSYLLEKKLNDIDKIISTCKVGETHESEKVYNEVTEKIPPQIKDSYLWITSETVPTQKDVMFITEKCLKSYLWYKPMIVYSAPHTIKVLNELGFVDVFELMGFDSSYDNEEDDTVRLEMIINEINIFIKKPIEEIHKLYNKDKVRNALIQNNKQIKKLIGSEKYFTKLPNDIITSKNVSITEEIIKEDIKYNSNKKFDERFKFFLKDKLVFDSFN